MTFLGHTTDWWALVVALLLITILISIELYKLPRHRFLTTRCEGCYRTVTTTHECLVCDLHWTEEDADEVIDRYWDSTFRRISRRGGEFHGD